MSTIEAIRNGDKFVFEQVYYEYHERFYFFVLNRTGSETLAEEIAQMTFIRLWEKRASLSPNFPINVQIARIARSLLIDTLRKRATERKAMAVIQARTEEVYSNDPAVTRELKEKVEAAISGLPPECRKIFVLNREQGLSYAEIATQLSISPKTVENQISKALRIVRKAVALSVLMTF